MTNPSSLVVLSLLSTKGMRPIRPRPWRERTSEQSEVFTLSGANLPLELKKVFGTKVRFLRTAVPRMLGSGSVGPKVSWLRKGCIWLLSHGYQGLPEVLRQTKVSWLRSPCGWFLMTLGQVAKVRFLRHTYLVSHCTFVIYNKVSLTY